MASKTITVTEDAYNAVRRMKGEHESFSDLFLRIGGKKALRDCVGILSAKSADALEKMIRDRREERRSLNERRRDLLWGKSHGSS